MFTHWPSPSTKKLNMDLEDEEKAITGDWEEQWCNAVETGGGKHSCLIDTSTPMKRHVLVIALRRLMEHVPFIALKLLMTLLTLPTALPGFWWIIEVLHVETHCMEVQYRVCVCNFSGGMGE